MAIGMSPQEYWEGPPYLTRAYYKAYKLKRELRNQDMWIQGMYFYNAVSTALSNAFSKRTFKYMDKPIEFYKDEEAQSEREAEKERAKAIDAFKAMRKKWESEHGNAGT